MEDRKAKCQHCGEIREISNVKFMRCSECDSLKQFAKKEKNKYQIKKVSKKQSKINQSKHKNFQAVKKRYCESCGCTNKPLSNSHIIPVSQSKDLEGDPENMITECMGDSESCHDIWEHGTPEQKMNLLTYQRKLNYMAEKQYIKGLQKLLK